jgi:hypothetical protein
MPRTKLQQPGAPVSDPAWRNRRAGAGSETGAPEGMKYLGYHRYRGDLIAPALFRISKVRSKGSASTVWRKPCTLVARNIEL